MIFITGDTHGRHDFAKVKTFAYECKLAGKDDYLIVAGDFGTVFNLATLDADLKPYEELPFTVLFVDGNHENFDLLNSFPVKMCHGGKGGIGSPNGQPGAGEAVGNKSGDANLKGSTPTSGKKGDAQTATISNYVISDKYALFYSSFTWKQAKAYAENLGGHLVTITSAEENEVVKQIFADSGLSAVWLGATDSDSEGNWKWVTGEDFVYSDWGQIDANSYEPNGGSKANYLVFYNAEYMNGSYKWDDTDSTTVQGFIVEFE